MANRKASRLLGVFAVCLLPIVTQAQTNNPKHPTWWAKYQYLAANGATKSGAQTSAVTVDKNVDASNECGPQSEDRKSTRLNSSHSQISYAVFCLKKKKKKQTKLIFSKQDRHRDMQETHG